MDVIAKKAFYGNSECARCSASLSKGCYWVPNNEISKVAVCEACYEKEKAAEIPEDLRELHAELYAAYDPLQQGESSAWKIRIPILIQIIERIASLMEQLRLSKAAYETNLATAEHNKRVAVNELNAEIRVLTEENARLKEDAEAFRFMRKKGWHCIATSDALAAVRAARTQEGDTTK